MRPSPLVLWLEILMIRVCFVCLGNICRSPTADGIMRHLVAQAGLARAIEVDSAGTGGWHEGEAADSRAQAVARERGYELTSRARKFTSADFARFDFILAMDGNNVRDLLALAPSDVDALKINLFRAYDPEGVGPDGPADVPDPYYGGPRGFDEVFDICERTCATLLEHIRRYHSSALMSATKAAREQ